MTIRTVTPGDAQALASIYNHYVRETIVTFEEEPVSPETFSQRIKDVLRSSLPWLVAMEEENAVGYAYATPWKPRSGYRFSVEVTVYVADGHAGRGIGSALYTELFSVLKARGVHAAIGGIALPNDASVALHEKFGMRKVAHFEQVGFKFDRWIDVGYWERVFEASPP